VVDVKFRDGCKIFRVKALLFFWKPSTLDKFDIVAYRILIGKRNDYIRKSETWWKDPEVTCRDPIGEQRVTRINQRKAVGFTLLALGSQMTDQL
jgi:hypothetical protein